MSETVSRARQNFSAECEAGINRQINMELYASYAYHSMWSYFLRDDVALPGFAKFFKKSSDEEREHAEKLIKYQNERGGRVKLADIKKPEKDEWGSGLDSLKTALQMERDVNEALLQLHRVAAEQNDAQFQDFIESEYLNEQVEAMNQLASYITQLERCGSGLGEYLFDKETLQHD